MLIQWFKGATSRITETLIGTRTLTQWSQPPQRFSGSKRAGRPQTLMTDSQALYHLLRARARQNLLWASPSPLPGIPTLAPVPMPSRSTQGRRCRSAGLHPPGTRARTGSPFARGCWGHCGLTPSCRAGCASACRTTTTSCTPPCACWRVLTFAVGSAFSPPISASLVKRAGSGSGGRTEPSGSPRAAAVAVWADPSTMLRAGCTGTHR
jgi:hypothetical protein